MQEENSEKINPVGQIHRDLTKIEKNLLNFGYKGELGKKRDAWRTVAEEIRLQTFKLAKLTDPAQRAAAEATVMKKKKKKKKDLDESLSEEEKIRMFEMKLRLCAEVMAVLEQEIVEMCDDGIGLISTIYYNGLQHRVVGIESRIFYQKLETDLNRYKLEMMVYHKREAQAAEREYEYMDEFQVMLSETKALYAKTSEEAEVMEPNHRLRLSINLNYSCFLYDVAMLVDEARDVAKKAFDAALD